MALVPRTPISFDLISRVSRAALLDRYLLILNAITSFLLVEDRPWEAI